MEEQIKRIVAYTKISYVVFWLVPVSVVVAGECGSGWVGLCVDNVQATYLAETLVILLTACCVPVSLKLFSWILVKKIDEASVEVALKLYARWSTIRLILLELPALAGCVAYYLMLSNKSILCALIALTASLFCLPGEGRLRNELKINGDDL